MKIFPMSKTEFTTITSETFTWAKSNGSEKEDRMCKKEH
jgi:hypothetical protein